LWKFRVLPSWLMKLLLPLLLKVPPLLLLLPLLPRKKKARSNSNLSIHKILLPTEAGFLFLQIHVERTPCYEIPDCRTGEHWSGI
jgi:hypothetical protein